VLITFKSPADADVLMLGPVGKQMLEILGKDANDARGIVTLEQLPAAVAALDAAFVHHQSQRRATETETDEEADDTPRGMAAPVSLAQRIVPLLNLLRMAQSQGQVVTWEAT
jgi:Domain of unknown function (DUF1840)